VGAPWFGDGLAVLITELEAAGPPGLGDRRTAFRQQGQVAGSGVLSALQRRESGWAQLLEQRAELLVGVQLVLVRAGVLRRMGKETPDFECRWQHTEFGVEVTTRARPEAASAMHDLLETGLQDGPDVGVTLTRTGKLLFSEDPVKTATIADQVLTRIKEMATAAAGQPLSGRIPVPELGLAAMVHDDDLVPGMRVAYESLLTQDQWDHHWKMAALQIKDTVEKKGRKAYALPSILVLDISRLGYAGQVIAGSWIAEFQGCAGRLRHRQPWRRPDDPITADLGSPGSPVLARRAHTRAGPRRWRRPARQPDGGVRAPERARRTPRTR
jgi:hypothetical protein